jgi:hypothetical protein
MAKSKKPEDEQNPQQPPQDQPGGDQGNDFVAPGPNPTGEPAQPQETPTPPAGEGEKPNTIVVGPEGEPVKGPEYEPETAPTQPPAPEQPQAPVQPAAPVAPAATPEAPKIFKHKSGIEIPIEDFDDETVVWAEKYDAAQRVWDAKKFTRTAWDKTTAGKARRYRSQPHSGWVRMAPPLPEWDAFDDDDPEGGEGRVGPRPGDRNNP